MVNVWGQDSFFCGLKKKIIHNRKNFHQKFVAIFLSEKKKSETNYNRILHQVRPYSELLYNIFGLIELKIKL